MLLRHDLLALTADDLAALANRGLVKRAQRELERGAPAGVVTLLPDLTLVVTWADGVTCTLPAGAALGDADCSCSQFGVCRHLVRAVLLYQQSAESHPSAPDSAESHAPWNPGTISDAALAATFGAARLRTLRAEFDAGHVVELVTSAKPAATFHTLALTVRFRVPGSLLYTTCDCAEPAPCRHVPLAVWAFRLLQSADSAADSAAEPAAEPRSALVESARVPLPVPVALLADVQTALRDLLELGVSGAAGGATARLAQRCAADGLTWPAAVLDDLGHAVDQYARGDARFAPEHVADLAGELLLRLRSLAHGTPGVPDLFVRGNGRAGRSDGATAVGTARLVGLGTHVRVVRGATIVTAYLQDVDDGALVALQEEVVDSAESPPAPFWQLARRPALRGASFADCGGSQVLVKGGRRLHNGVLRPGRAPASIISGPPAWDRLHAPLLAEEFAEIRARLAGRPPSALRPRRVGDDLFVVPVQAARDARFDGAGQYVAARLLDGAGGDALLALPYYDRGADGCEALLGWLTRHGDALRAVAGRVQVLAGRCVVQPTGLVFDVGGERQLVQPWIARWDAPGRLPPQPPRPVAAIGNDPRHAYPAALRAALGRLWVTGVRRADVDTARDWAQLAQAGEQAGFVRLHRTVAALAAALGRRPHDLAWTWDEAAAAALDLTAVVRLAQDIP